MLGNLGCVKVLTFSQSENVAVTWYIKRKDTIGYKNVMDDLGGCIQL